MPRLRESSETPRLTRRRFGTSAQNGEVREEAALKPIRSFVLLLISVTVSACVVVAQPGGAPASSNPSFTAIDPTSGKQLYASYCALCHGPDGKGGGPFSPQLKVWPPDLTGLLTGNHGVFPAMRVAAVIDGEFARPSHGSAEMPIWGPVFRSMAHGRKDSARVRIDSLVRYLEAIQQK